jgi:hypothetical protein
MGDAPGAPPVGREHRLAQDTVTARGTASSSGQYRTNGMVLESPDDGPQLCQAVSESYRPGIWDGEGFTRNGTEWRRFGFAQPMVGPERSLGRQVGQV